MYTTETSGDEINEYTLTTAWDISTASFSQVKSVRNQTDNPYGLFFKPDGKQVFVGDGKGEAMLTYFLSTAWDISTASYTYPDTDVFSVATQEANPQGLTFSTDGHKMYVIGTSGDDVNEYDVTLAWDVTSATFNQTFSVSSEESSPTGIFFKTDGTKFYITGSSGDEVNEYNLTTAWDVSTASYNQNLSVSSVDNNPQDIFFKDDGTRMYIIGDQNNKIYQFEVSTPWDISTATYTTGQDFSTTTGVSEYDPTSFHIGNEGRTLYVTGERNKQIAQYSLSSAWDVTSGSYSDVTFHDICGLEDDPSAITFKSDGTKFYFLGINADRVYQGYIEERTDGRWDTNKSPWALFKDQPQNWHRVNTQETSPQGVFFKSDGLRMYVIGTTGDDVNEYELTSPWDVRSASYVQNFSVSSQDTSPQGIFFKSDGLKMFVVGQGNDKVYEYTLTTAWDISTASYSQDLSISANETEPEDIFFKPDGTEMYICGNQRNAILQYTLTTGWDISTASYTRERATTSQDLTPRGVFFKEDGLKMYVWGNYYYRIIQYTLSTAWDVSSVTNTQYSSAVSYFLRYGQSLFFKSDGEKCYVIDSTKNYVAQLSLSTAWDATTATFDEPTNDYLNVADK
jgi:6-phosphogluconolactonase (cycloisomerase 2 family)